MKHCPACGREGNEGARYCTTDGRLLVSAVTITAELPGSAAETRLFDAEKTGRADVRPTRPVRYTQRAPMLAFAGALVLVLVVGASLAAWTARAAYAERRTSEAATVTVPPTAVPEPAPAPETIAPLEGPAEAGIVVPDSVEVIIEMPAEVAQPAPPRRVVKAAPKPKKVQPRRTTRRAPAKESRRSKAAEEEDEY